MRNTALAALLSMALSAVYLPSSAQCPPFNTLDQASVGQVSELPDGYCVFTMDGRDGVYKSDIKEWDPVLIPNTGSDEAGYLEISDDGQWLVYSSRIQNMSADGTIIRIDGTHKTRYSMTEDDPPNTDKVSRTGCVTGWLRSSPTGGQEVFYIPGPFNAWAKKIDLSSGVPVIGEKRCLFEIHDMAGVINQWWGATAAAAADQLIGRIVVKACKDMAGTTGQSGVLPGYITIPESGQGTAGWEDRYQYARDCDSMGQCGATMSHDGQYCAFNISYDDVMCAPTRTWDPDMDHKGFIVTRFLRSSDQAVKASQIVVDGQIAHSLVWCPPEYRRGDTWAVNWDDWYFSNDNRYIIGGVTGNKLTQYGLRPGLWVVDWRTAGWFEVTPAGNTGQLFDPALHLYSAAPVEPLGRSPARSTAAAVTHRIVPIPSTGVIGVPVGTSYIAVHALNGALVWEKRYGRTSDATAVTLPSSLAGIAVLVATH